jgi:hypothetical protein
MERARRLGGSDFGSITTCALSIRVVVHNTVLSEIIGVGRSGVEETHRDAGTGLGQIRGTCLINPDALLSAVDPELPQD